MWVFHRVTGAKSTASLGRRLYSVQRMDDSVDSAHYGVCQSSEEWLRLLESFVDHAGDAILITDAGRMDPPGPQIVYVNRAFTRLTGYSSEEVIGKTPRILHGRQTQRTVLDQIRTALLKGEPVHTELINYRKDGGEFWADLDIVPIKDDGGRITHWAASTRDVTDRKRTEQRLWQASTMETVGRMASGVAHDFNNLLTVISGYAQMLLGALSPEDPSREDAEEIAKAAERATALTRRLLAFSRHQVSQPQPLALNTVVSSMSKLLRRMIGDDVELVTILRPDLGRVKTDHSQMEQVLMNLVANARDAMPGGGRITIETGNVELQEEYARTHIGVAPGDYVMLCVSDTGQGMDHETKVRVFEPFFTTKDAGRGTGLGLSTVYGIIKQNGGDVDVLSELGKGTTIRIYLPRYRETAAEKELVEPVRRPLEGTETVLLVEDEASVRRLLRELLRKQGYTVLEAHDGREALRIGAEHHGAINLLLTDIVMPQMSGGELVQRLRSLRPEVKVLYISGYADNVSLNKETLDPGKDFLQKPFTPDTLLRKLRDLLQLVDSPAQPSPKPRER